jgi:hypothetical protein
MGGQVFVIHVYCKPFVFQQQFGHGVHAILVICFKDAKPFGYQYIPVIVDGLLRIAGYGK